MPKYNVFEEFIDEDVREKHELLMAQTRALINASNIINDAMNSWSKSQKELSQHLGLSKGYVSRLLSGTENISLKNFAGVLHMLGYELNMSAEKIKSYEAGNIIWADFVKADSQVSFESSTAEKSSPWSDSLIQKAI
jgi:AraC-like DNA-binding protein